MPSWNNYVPGKIIKICKKIIDDEFVLCESTSNIMLETIDNIFDICFPSCLFASGQAESPAVVRTSLHD